VVSCCSLPLPSGAVRGFTMVGPYFENDDLGLVVNGPRSIEHTAGIEHDSGFETQSGICYYVFGEKLLQPCEQIM
jgi:hypothetical protein